MNYYISDTHFGHSNCLEFENRPFKTVEEMEDKIVENWNNCVSNVDTVYILGDFCWSRRDAEWCRILDRLNGNKFLIKGNHDLEKMSPVLKEKFIGVYDIKKVKDCGRNVLLCHYPLLFYPKRHLENAYMLCGHVHISNEDNLLEKWREELKSTKGKDVKNVSYGNIINVGCMKDYMDYTPRTLDYLIEHYKKGD